MKSLSAMRYLRRKLFAPWHEPSYRDALELFLHAVRGQGAVTPDLWDGYRSLEVVCAAETSAHTGRPVALAASAREL
ncbi:MAG TPA: Gfo/Idh/MocA family oxidoreductase, partial [Nitrospira sp.]